MRALLMIFTRFLMLALAAGGLAAPALADDAPPYLISVKDHAFAPGDLAVPAGQKIKLIVKNEDAEAMEFESMELNREKVIPGHSEGFVYVGPLDAGTYPFFDDFHRDTTKGKLTAK